MNDSMSLAELADASGIPARTIRFYISRGVLSGPSKAGRGAAYGQEHLARLSEIQRLQGEGRTIAEIGRGSDAVSPEIENGVPATAWWQHKVSSDVMVWVRDGMSPWRTRQVRAALAEFAARLRQAEDQEQKEQEES